MATILVVDDNELFGETLADLLTMAGHRGLCATGGQDALKQLHHELPDVILLDLYMHDMSGIETLQAIRGNDRSRSIPIVMISALGEEEEIARAKAAGADDFWVKTTFDFDELNRRLQQFVQTHPVDHDAAKKSADVPN